MGWLLGCFKCTGEPQQVKPKKQSSAAVNLVSGRANSAAVAPHATSPEDLHRVRRSPSNSAVANSDRDVERERLDSSSSSLPSFQSQTKKNECANLVPKPNTANKLNREKPHNRKLVDELENFRERLIQEPDAEKQLGDEDARTCHSLLEPAPNALKVTFNKDTTGQADFAQQSWLVSSLVTRSGLLFEACSRPSSAFPGLHEHGSFHSSRGVQASQSIDFYDNLGSSNALKCAELNLFRVESGVSDECVNGIRESSQPTYCKLDIKAEAAPSGHAIQSPPWIFSEAKLDIANHNSSYIFESSDNLLLEHLDVSSLIEDSALITNWERSSGELHSEKWGLHDQSSHSFQVPSVDECKLPQLSGQKKQKHLENGADGDSLDSNSGCSMVDFEVRSDGGTGLFAWPSVGEGCCSSKCMPSEAQAIHDASCDKEFIYAVSNINSDAKARLLQAECCTDIEESDNESSSQSCFSSQFRLSKRLWSSTRKNTFERDSSMAGHLHDNDSDVDEVLLPCTRPEMQPLQESKNPEDEYYPLLNASTLSSDDIRINYNECLGVPVDNHTQSSTASFSEALVWQDSVEVFAFEDETVAMREGDLTFPTEEENVEQRKKLRLGHSSSFERVQESMLVVKDEQVRLLNTATFGDHHERSSEATVDFFNGLESSASEQLLDESSLQQTSDISFASPSSSHVQTSVASYQTPSRLADDRPILGTVAAHWSPITTKKWWDGKGIPNSTNKYKEDQKVNWHAIPFEVRLEQALAKQDSVLSK